MKLPLAVLICVCALSTFAVLKRSSERVPPAPAPAVPSPTIPDSPPNAAPEANETPRDISEPSPDIQSEAPKADEPEPQKPANPRARGLVLWKGEWMLPEERAAKRKAEDDAKAALNKPRAHHEPEPVEDTSEVSDEPQFAPGQFRQVDIPGPSRFIGPRGGTGHYSKNGKKVYDKKSEVELPRVASRSLYATGILFHNIPRAIHGCQTYAPQADASGHQVFVNGEAVYNEYVPDIPTAGECNVTDFRNVAAGIINVGEHYFYVNGVATRGQYRIVDLKVYGSDVLPVLQLAN